MGDEPKPRRVEITLYRCGCRHCDSAEAQLTALAKRHGALLQINRVENDPDLKNLAGWRTPVVCVDGRQITHYEINPKKWDAAIKGEYEIAPSAIVGEVVDIDCFLREGVKGEKHRECAQACLKEGVPIGLATRSGEIYLLIQDRAAREPYQRLIKLASEMVVITGDVCERAGMHAIVVKDVEMEKKRAGWI